MILYFRIHKEFRSRLHIEIVMNDVKSGTFISFEVCKVLGGLSNSWEEAFFKRSTLNQKFPQIESLNSSFNSCLIYLRVLVTIYSMSSQLQRLTRFIQASGSLFQQCHLCSTDVLQRHLRYSRSSDHRSQTEKDFLRNSVQTLCQDSD